jgi:hypothetical protein
MGCNRRARVVFPVYSGYEVRIPARHGVGWLILGPKPAPRTIAHESAHAVYALAAHVGTTFDEETFAYHLGHLVEQIHEFLKKGIKKHG